MLLFVYGTLLAGEASHAELAGAVLLGPARTSPDYELVDLGDYPALLRRGATSVAGELYDVAPDLLARLDAFEGHPTLFRRATVRLGDGRRAAAYLYPRRRAKTAARIDCGDYRAHARRARAGARAYSTRASTTTE
ncbi:MAG TPA: gamma-glutamylcyclotransferase family protein [Minicystis sp.]|nr:gamma-glutamylcyclotransferase family protein [Minicystis sp.]